LLNRLIDSILKVFFNLLYHQFAWSYDWVADIVSLGRWKGWVFTILPNLGDGRILELGSGPGHLQAKLLTDRQGVFGLDSSWQMLRLSQRNISIDQGTSNLVMGTAQASPFQDRSFPTIVATFPSNYITDSQTLEQAWRVLEDGGRMVIMPAAWIAGTGLLDRFAAWIFSITGEAPVFDGDDLHHSLTFTIDRLVEFGFEVSHELIEGQSSKILIIHAVKPMTTD
jgi:ubiquinone/menaquinone biosynthesis C-methylase UbiE